MPQINVGVAGPLKGVPYSTHAISEEAADRSVRATQSNCPSELDNTVDATGEEG
jgi:hypothetical protein